MPDIVIAVILVAVVLVISWAAKRSVGLQVERPVCCWCKKPIDENQPAVSKAGTEDLILGKSGMAHMECEESAYRRHRRYFLCFFALAVMVFVPLIFSLATQPNVTWHEIGTTMETAWPVAFFPLFIYSHLRPWRRSIDAAKAAASNQVSEQA